MPKASTFYEHRPPALPAPGLSQVALYAPTPKARRRVTEFFATQVNNDHTRKAYLNAARRFSVWCAAHSIEALSAVEPTHIAAFVKLPCFSRTCTRMIRNRAVAAKITTPRVCCHSLRATGITAYMKNCGRLEVAQQIANY